METKTGYIYSEDTKEYLNEIVVQKNPYNEAEYLTPDNFTFKKPMDKQEEKTPCFIDNKWSLVTDHRKKPLINLSTLKITTCNYIGEVHDGYQFITEEIKEDFLRDNEKYKVVDGVFTDISNTEEYQNILKNRRKENFEREFLLTSKGNYRLMPKGYANAQQSIDTINNIVNASGGLTEQIANMVIFYDTPDFTKPEECTEEWLVQHQHHPEPMTIQQWVEFYIEFTTLYAQKQYKAGLTL